MSRQVLPYSLDYRKQGLDGYSPMIDKDKAKPKTHDIGEGLIKQLNVRKRRKVANVDSNNSKDSMKDLMKKHKIRKTETNNTTLANPTATPKARRIFDIVKETSPDAQ